MVIHSYSSTLSSVRAFSRGFDEALKHDKNPSTLTYYMNTLNRQKERNKVGSGVSAVGIIEDFKPQVIVAVGEEAQEYVTKKYINHPEIKVVYAKIKRPELYGYETAKNITGVREQFPLKEVKNVLLDLSPKKRLKLASIGDQTTLMSADDNFIIEHSWDPHVITDSLMVKDFDEWKKAIRKLNKMKEVDFILVSNYRNIKASSDSQKVLYHKDVIAWTIENSEIPVVGLYETNSKDGVPISISTSSYTEGQSTAKLVLEIIQESSVKTKQSETRHFLVSLNAKYSMYDDLKVPEVYKSFAIASGLYYESSRRNGKYKI